MSANENGNQDINEAREARRRAEDMLSKVQRQRPEIEELSERTTVLLVRDSYSALVTQAFSRRTA